MLKFIYGVVVFGLLLSLTLSCAPASQAGTGGATIGSYTDVTPQEAKNLIEQNPGIIIIDVSPHYAEGHLPGAVSYEYTGVLADAIPKLDKNKIYLVYCRGGLTSMAASNKLVNAGFKYVYRLNGNYDGWVQAGYPVEK